MLAEKYISYGIYSVMPPPPPPPRKRKGLELVFLDDTFAMDFVPVLISRLKLGADCRIDFFFFSHSESYLHRPVARR